MGGLSSPFQGIGRKALPMGASALSLKMIAISGGSQSGSFVTMTGEWSNSIRESSNNGSDNLIG